MDTPRKYLPKGFLSRKNRPTFNAVTMFFIYLKNLPKGWNIKELNEVALSAVRQSFGTSYGFSTMIMWGIWHGCGVSKTSSGRHQAMSEAYIVAKQMLNFGIQ